MAQDIPPPERSNSPLPTANCSPATVPWPWWLLAAYVGFVVLSLLCVVWVCVRADEAGQTCLDAFTPLIQWIVKSGRWLTREPNRRVSILGWVLFGLIGLLAAGGLAKRRREGIRPALILAAGGLAVLGQTVLFTSAVVRGCVLYGLAIVLIVVWRYLPRSLGPGLGDSLTAKSNSEPRNDFPKKRTVPLIVEVLCLTLITTGTILFYFYGLNHLPRDFEGEMAFYMAVSTSIDGSVKVNYGAPGAFWSPLGLMYYLLLYMTERTCGTTLLAARFVSALVGVLLINLFYGLLRRIGGVSVALIGAGLLACSSLSIAWSRQDFFPFAYPSLVVLALAWTTYLAVETEKYRFFLLAALLMGATYHLFPSGQTGFLIPLGVLTWHLLMTRGFARRCWWKMSAIVFGVALWVMGLPLCCYLATGSWRWLDPLALNRGKTLWSLNVGQVEPLERAVFFVEKVWHNILGFVECLFVGNIWPVHQTAFYGMANHPPTYVSGVTAVLLVLGVVVLLLSPRRKVSSILLIWIVVASLPGILSTQATARRLATIFPALLAAAALAAEGGFRTVQFLFGRRSGAVCRIIISGTVIVVLFILHGSYYFWQTPASPPSVNMARAMRPYLKPNTLVVADIQHTYYTAAEVTYMMLDELNRGDDPAVWYLPKPEDWPALAIWPRPDFDAWYYKYTFLQERLPNLRSRAEWDRITYVLQDLPETQRRIEMLKNLFPEAPVSKEQHTPGHGWYDFVVLETNAEKVRDLRKPVAKITGEPEGLPDTSQGWWDPVEVRFFTATSAAVPETPGVTLSAALRVEEQRWESFRVEGGGKSVEFRLDGRSLKPDRIIPLTGGFHRIDVQVGPPWQLPITLQSQTDGRGEYRTVSSDRLVAPRLADIADLAAQAVVPYSGFGPPERVVRVEEGYGADLAVSPAGKIAIAGVFADSWKIQIFQRNGTKVAEWSSPIPMEAKRRGCLLTFAGEERIAVIDWRWPKVVVYNLTGEIVTEIELPPYMDQTQDIGGNQHGELFIPSPWSRFVLHISLDGDELGRLVPPADGAGRRWRPWLVSVPFDGPMAVVNDLGDIHVFEGGGPSPGQRRWARVIHPRPEGGRPLMQMRQDGWCFVRYFGETEFRVLDDQNQRRVADERAHDLSRLVIHRCNQIVGFDRAGNLYIWHEAPSEVLRLAPRLP